MSVGIAGISAKFIMLTCLVQGKLSDICVAQFCLRGRVKSDLNRASRSTKNNLGDSKHNTEMDR